MEQPATQNENVFGAPMPRETNLIGQSKKAAEHHKRYLKTAWGKTPVRYKGDAHLITIAPTGSGKGRSAIIPNLLIYNGPIIVIDPKCENYAVTAERRKAIGHKVIVLDPFKIQTNMGDRLNPMDIFDLVNSDIDSDAQMLAELLSEGNRGAKELFSDLSANGLNTQIKPQSANFIALKADHPGLQHIFLDVFVAEVLADLTNYPLDGHDLAYILRSGAYDLLNKLTIIEAVDENIITGSNAALTEISRLMYQHHPLPVSKPIMIAVLNQPAPLDQQIQLFNMYNQNFDSGDAQAVFKNFPPPYNKIGLRHTSFIVPAEGEFKFLANNLEQIHMIHNQKPDKKGIKSQIINGTKCKLFCR
jgi:hypothetical protein